MIPSGLRPSDYVFDKVVRVYTHILQNLDGSGLFDPDRVGMDVVRLLNSKFSGSGIYFVHAGNELHNYLTSSGLDLNTIKYGDPIFSLSRHSDGVDIYVPCNAVSYTGGNVEGVSEGLKGGSIITSDYVSSTLAHEMGHSLGLYHTHMGTYKLHNPESTSEIEGDPEYVDGSNSLVAGDLVSDTPADPKLWDSNGNYAGGSSAKDQNGQIYSPDPYNIMSYSSKASRFSQGQIVRMHYFLSDKLSQFLARPEISGASHFSQSAQYKATGIQGSNFEWLVRRHRAASSIDDQPESVVKERYSISTNPLTVTSSESEYIEIGITLSGSSEDFLSVKKTTTNAPSPITGSLMWTISGNGTGWHYSTNMDWGDPLELYFDNTTLYLDYSDKAAAKLSNLNFSTVTAANRVLRGNQIVITKSDCARGYLKFKISDACGTSSGYFTIPVAVKGSYYSFGAPIIGAW